jgi:hypothetical protein
MDCRPWKSTARVMDSMEARSLSDLVRMALRIEQSA